VVVSIGECIMQQNRAKIGKKYPYTVPRAKNGNVSSLKIISLRGVLGVGSSLVVT